MKKSILVSISLFLVFSLCACGISEAEIYETTERNVSTTETTSPEGTTASGVEETTEPATEPYTDPESETFTETISQTLSTEAPLPPPKPSEPAAQPPTEETTLGKTGEMAFSDSPDNRYIKAVAEKYNVKAENLVAIYTVPQNDSNTVLEFSGKRDSSGKLIRDTSTLVSIYTIDANLNSRRASKDESKNEYDSGEMMVMFFAVTSYIMPEFKDQL